MALLVDIFQYIHFIQNSTDDNDTALLTFYMTNDFESIDEYEGTDSGDVLDGTTQYTSVWTGVNTHIVDGILAIKAELLLQSH